MDERYQLGITFLKPYYQNIPDDVEAHDYMEATITSTEEFLEHQSCFIVLTSSWFYNPGSFDFYSHPTSHQEALEAIELINYHLGTKNIKINLLEVTK